jgi:hypothetical protein
MLIVELCKLWGVRVHAQNVGVIPLRNERGDVIRMYDPGPPVGAADITGGYAPEGVRIEIELKSSRGKRSREQVRWAEFCAEQGYLYLLYEYNAKLTREHNLMNACSDLAAAIAARRCHHA